MKPPPHPPHLLREAHPGALLAVAERRSLENGHGQFQNFPQKLVELRVHHDTGGVRDLREDIWEHQPIPRR